MKKKTYKFIALIGALVVLCFMMIILRPFITAAYLDWKEKQGAEIRTCYTVGTFSGYRVDLIQWRDTGAFCVLTPYYVDDVYISTFPDTSYTYIVYTSETDYVILEKAYEQSLITHDDLLAIAEAEKPRDNLKQDKETQVQQSLAIA